VRKLSPQYAAICAKPKQFYQQINFLPVRHQNINDIAAHELECRLNTSPLSRKFLLKGTYAYIRHS